MTGKPTPGFVRMDRWDNMNKEARILYGCPTPDAKEFSNGVLTSFMSEADAREFVVRWNLCEQEKAKEPDAAKKEKK